MPRFQALVSELNSAFSQNQIAQTARLRDEFAPDKPLDVALARLVAQPDTVEYRAFKTFVGKIPHGLQKVISATLLHSLTEPYTLVTCAWAPGYDYEVDLWQAPDTPETRGGITILFKSRYPDDRHPIAPPETS